MSGGPHNVVEKDISWMRVSSVRLRHMAGEGGPQELKDAGFENFVKGNTLAAVDFWAPWCGPCRMMAPNFEALAKAYVGKIAFGKVNVDDNPKTSEKFGIMSIPTILLFKNGKMVHQMVGFVPKEMLDGEIKKHLQ
jgi:thioredoxin 1